MATGTTTAIATAAAGKRILGEMFSDLYDTAKGELRARFALMRTAKSVETTERLLRRVRRVKTIWQHDRDVDLRSFYCPSYLVFQNHRRQINDLGEIPWSDSILITGIAGQGKSIFLRYLAATELHRTVYFPLFLEFNRLKGRPLREGLKTAMSGLGLPPDWAVLSHMAKQGKLLVLLDGLDETSQTDRERLITEIEEALEELAGARWIVSSRPGSGLEASPHFRVVQLSGLRGNEFEAVVRKLSSSQAAASRIIAGVKERPNSIRAILDTPLMVSMLVFRHNINESIPDTEVQFYADLLPILLERHDGTKPGFKRPRLSSLSDLQLVRAFQAFSFFTWQQDQTAMPLQRAVDAMEQGLEYHSLPVSDCEAALKDLSDVTCLIVSDGENRRFLHKTVQEFHAAQFVAKLPEAVWPKLADQLPHHLNSWSKFLDFLEHLAPQNFGQHIALRFYSDMLGPRVDPTSSGHPDWWNDYEVNYRYSHATSEEAAQHLYGARCRGYSPMGARSAPLPLPDFEMIVFQFLTNLRGGLVEQLPEGFPLSSFETTPLDDTPRYRIPISQLVHAFPSLAERIESQFWAPLRESYSRTQLQTQEQQTKAVKLFL